MAESTESATVEHGDFEESDPFKKVTDMILTRASAIGSNSSAFKRLYFDHVPTQIDRLQLIRDAVYALAPNFVNMDYPYWDYCWAKFPQFYSQDMIDRDEEHSLNILPTNLCSFNESSLDLYHKFMDNAVYWLQKFRYARCKNSWRNKKFNLTISYDKVYKYFRNGQIEYYNWHYYRDADGQSVDYPDMTINWLRNYSTGWVYDDGLDQNTENGFSVYLREYHNIYKIMDTPGREDLPMQDIDPDRDNYGREIQYMPQDIIGGNPSGYQAELLWFIINEGYKNQWTKSKNEVAITEYEQIGTVRWGSQNQFSAPQYSPTEGTELTASYVSRRNDYKETESDLKSGTTERKVKTNWSDDGTRSAVISDTTTSISHYVPSGETINVSQHAHPTFGFVTFSADTWPCFSAGMIEPHGSLSYHVCDQTSLLLPTWGELTQPYVDQNYQYRWEEQSLLNYWGTTQWIPILDFGDYIIPEPE